MKKHAEHCNQALGGESRIRRFFRAFLSFFSVSDMSLSLYEHDWVHRDDRIALRREEARRRHYSIRGIY